MDDSPLIVAAEAGDLEKLQEILQSEGFEKDIHELSVALEKAAEKNKTECVKLLAEAGGDVNKQCRAYYPINWAVINKNVDLVDYFIKAGAEINNDRSSCLHMTSSIPIIDLLLKAGANIDTLSYDDCVTPLNSAGASGNVELVKFLLDRGANVNSGSVYGSILESATYNNNAECVRLMLPKTEEDPTLSLRADDTGRSFLMAAKYGHMETLQVYLDFGINVNTKVKSWEHNVSKYNRETAMMKAAAGDKVKCMEFLLKKGASLKDVDDFGNDLLMYASKEGSCKAIEFLIKKGFNVNVRNKQKETPLIKAIDRPYVTHHGYGISETYQHKCSIQCVKLLVDSGADVNKKSEAGDTALNMAAKHNQPEYIKVFLSAGCRINTFNKAGQNAYIWHVEKARKKSEDLKLMLFAAGESTKKFKCKATIFNSSDAAPESSLFSGCLPLFCANPNKGPKMNVVYNIDWSCWADDDTKKEVDKNEEDGDKEEDDNKETEEESDGEKISSLKESCRDAIRRRLLEIDPFRNLFKRVPLLGVPPSLTSYVLFDVDLTLAEPQVTDEEDNDTDTDTDTDDASENAEVADNEEGEEKAVAEENEGGENGGSQTNKDSDNKEVDANEHGNDTEEKSAAHSKKVAETDAKET